MRVRLPDVNAIAIKTNSGAEWMGATNKNARPSELDINNAQDVKRWADTCASLNLDCIAWCVVNGDSPAQEAERILEVCAVPGISAMVLDVEAGEPYFRGSCEDARYIARTIRQSAPQKHIGLCFDARGRHPEQIYIEEWLPYMTGLHPMIYPETFRRDPVLAVKDAFGVLSKYQNYKELPVTVWIGAHSLYDSASLLRAVPAIFDRNPRAEGLVLWRYGDDVMRDKEFKAVRRVTIPEHVALPSPPILSLKSPLLQLSDGLRNLAYRTHLVQVVRKLKRTLK